ncbi:MAG: DNA polymerase III subunit gamma/tau, partial [Alphaproteobacteria bacterium]|nr:DNA polymerase III subunit gamma/tau [Alphaproteobacteria bacterium]
SASPPPSAPPRPEPRPPQTPPAAAPGTAATPVSPLPRTLAEVAALAQARREFRLYAALMSDVHGVSVTPGHIVLRAGPSAPHELARALGERLAEWTARPWTIELSEAEGKPTLAEQNATAERARRSAAAEDPLVRSVLETFPGAEIREVRERSPAAPEAESQSDTEHA